MAKQQGTMLTTIDNPHNPHTDYNRWLEWDQEHGYFTQEYLARIANVSAGMSEVEALPLIDLAKEEIIKHNTLGIYKLV